MLKEVHKVVLCKKKKGKIVSMEELFTGTYYECYKFICKNEGKYKGVGLKLDILTTFNPKDFKLHYRI